VRKTPAEVCLLGILACLAAPMAAADTLPDTSEFMQVVWTYDTDG